MWSPAGSALQVNGCIPVALSNSEGVGSVQTVVWLPDAHLYIQVLGISYLYGRRGSRHQKLSKV